ncbi:MAG: 23S rRNA pseudouridine(1911/1915/1917) synthase RluD [Halothiobacillaceae bacterium]
MKITHDGEIPLDRAGQRLDQVLPELWPQYSRSRIQDWIRAGDVLVDGRALRPRDRVLGGESVRLHAEQAEETEAEAQPIELAIVFEDEHLIVLDKPAGLVVHPGAGNPDGTLVNALLHHDPGLRTLARAGIVHRLDKDTTGLMVVARSALAQKRLIEQLAARTVSREYDAVVDGTLVAGGTVDAPIGRHPRDRQRQAVVQGGREAVTHYRVFQRFVAHTWLRLRLETGRTHQIRVHMAHLRHPLVGDLTYGGRPRLPPAADEALTGLLRGFGRQALHARRLALEHPTLERTMQWEAPLPADMQDLVDGLARHAGIDEDDEPQTVHVRE